jgi:hypothetical protein
MQGAMMMIARSLLLCALAVAAPAAAQAPAPMASLHAQWRQLAAIGEPGGVPDYGSPAIARLTDRLRQARALVAAVDRSKLTRADAIDLRVIEAEMNGLDFQLRTLQPWARDPGFYLTVWAEQSDVPGHEGSYAPVVDLWRYAYPLSARDAAEIERKLRAVPPLLEQARRNLAPSTAHDLFRYGARAFREQAATLAAMEAGTLDMRSLDGHRRIDLSGRGRRLLPAIRAARIATEGFAAWVEAEAPKRTGPSGVGKEAYDWAARNVYLLPWGWDTQVALLQRELDRAWAALKLEEVHNRDLPPLSLSEDPATFARLSREKAVRFTDFLIAKGFVPDRPYYRAAIPAQAMPFAAPAERNFFGHVVAADPLPLYSHFYHWIELARLKHEPLADPVRQGPQLFDLWQDRSEGMATAVEEIALHAGLYDDLPRGRELVWIMLANRAARGLASLYVQANQMTLEEAGRFHARWTPRGWSNPDSPLVAFEQLLYLRQPGYGTSYILGKLQLDALLARAAERADRERRPFDAAATTQALWQSGTIPFSLIDEEINGAP